MSDEAVELERRRLLPSTFARLFSNLWVAGEDRLTTPDQVRACVGHHGPLDPAPGRHYCDGLDVGLKSDRTVYTVAQIERRAAPTVVVDRRFVWQGTRDRPVDLEAVEATAAEALSRYRGKLLVDPFQAVHLVQRLRRRGLNVAEFTFSSASVGRLALTLYRLLRDALLDLDGALLDELARVRLVETQPGAYRIDHVAGSHDDRVISLALCAHALAGRPDGHGSITSSAGRPLLATTIVRQAAPTTSAPAIGRHQRAIARRQGVAHLINPDTWRPPRESRQRAEGTGSGAGRKRGGPRTCTPTRRATCGASGPASSG